MEKNKKIMFPTPPPKFDMPESPEAKYWREKYEITTKHLMVAVKEWGKLRQQVEEGLSKVA
jgi:hypothetical protein